MKKINQHPNRRPIRISSRVSLDEFKELERLIAQYSQKNISDFIRKRVFNEKITVVKIDEDLHKELQILSDYVAEIRKVGVNYNQLVKKIHQNYGEDQTKVLLSKIFSETKSLVTLSKSIEEYTTNRINNYKI